MRDIEKLGEAPIGHVLLSNCMHSSAALLVYSIYNITDTLIVSWGVNETDAGAIAVVSPVMLMLSAISTTMGSGGAVLLSKALGKKDTDNAAKITANVFVIFWLFAIFVTIIGLLFLAPMLKMIGVTENLYPYAKDYAAIILLGAITSTAFSSLIRAEGAMRFALKIWFIPVVVNLVLDCLFVFAFHSGICGAALATVISQIISVCMYIWFFFMRKDRTYKISCRSFQIDFRTIKNIVWLGLPSLVSQFSSSIFLVLINRYLGAFHSEQAITSMGFAMKIQTFLTMPQNGMLQGMQPLLGYNYSNGKAERVDETLKKAVIMSFGYGLFLAGVAICFGNRLLAIFTSNEDMVKFGNTCLIFITVTAALKSYCPLITTFYQAIGNARNALTIIAVSMIIKVLTIVTMANGWRTEGILWSFVITDILTFMFTAVFLIINSKKKGCR